MNFFKTPAVLKYVYPNLLWDKKKENKQQQLQRIYLTFDDGPIPGVTEFVLDILKSYQANATFFCVGENIERYPELYRKLFTGTHIIGNHTYHHINGWEARDQDYFSDIGLCENALHRHLKEKTSVIKKIFRPPYGKIKKSQIQFLRHEYTIAMWDILSGDFDPDFDAEKCLQKCISHTSAGTIIIFHDSYKAEKNLHYVLPRYLDHFISKGFRFDVL